MKHDDATGKSTESDKGPRARNRERTLKQLRAAISNLQQSGKGISITSIAEEAGVVPSTIHKVYPEIAKEIRTLTGNDKPSKAVRKTSELADAIQVIRDLRHAIGQLDRDLAKVASERETLVHENASLKAQLAKLSGKK